MKQNFRTNLVSSSGCRGVTLVELSVVIAICLVLIVLILPRMRAVQEKVWSSKCAQNLRQIMEVVHRYSADHNGDLPWISPSGSDSGYSAGDGVNNFSPVVALGVGGYFDENPQILLCPGWRNWKRNGANHNGLKVELPINTANGGSRNSIRYSYNWRNMRPTNWNPPSGKWALTPKVKLASVNEPSKEWYVCDQSPGTTHQTKAVTYSHTTGGLAGYLDGHVSWLNKDEWKSASYSKSPKDVPGQFSNP